MVHPVHIRDLTVGSGGPLLLIAGPCVIESEALALDVAFAVKDIAARVGLPYVFKASYDKANRTSIASFRGPGVRDGLAVLARVKEQAGVAILTDIHEPWHADEAAQVADVLQIPAFLCRQTDLIVAAAKTGRVVNVKKGQFLAPRDMRHAVAKVQAAGNNGILLTERGSSFGYNNLVVDMRAFPMMRDLGFPVIFDVTHSLQLPGAGEDRTAGLAQYIEPLASAGVAMGVDGVFLEVHPDPSKAQSDAQNALRLSDLERVLQRLVEIDGVVKKYNRAFETSDRALDQPR
ncbi:MAG: 3-deoxy-8-phosphooctulonate synthase [Bacteroidales bacterium]